tara:strand:+ start:434 stop:568 length:135 start_codon:yes stop_codon:yes gene_type:complete
MPPDFFFFSGGILNFYDEIVKMSLGKVVAVNNIEKLQPILLIMQ